MIGTMDISKSPASTESPEEIGGDQNMAAIRRRSSDFGGGDISSLELKLRELERKREELAACQKKVDVDIQAVKRTMELVAMA
jgi:hypothetical protein